MDRDTPYEIFINYIQWGLAKEPAKYGCQLQIVFPLYNLKALLNN